MPWSNECTVKVQPRTLNQLRIPLFFFLASHDHDETGQLHDAAVVSRRFLVDRTRIQKRERGIVAKMFGRWDGLNWLYQERPVH